MASIDKSIKLAIYAAVALWFGAASAKVPYTCYQSEIRIGNEATGGAVDGVVFYLVGREFGKFMDELTMVWSGHESSSDLRCWRTKKGRQCFLAEDSGIIDLDFRGELPQLRPYHGQIYLGRDDGGQYHIYVAPNRAHQTLEFIPIPQALCDFVFPEALRGKREIVVPPPGSTGDEANDSARRPPMTLIPIRPKN